MDASYFIEKLKLEPHPEGGFYKETFYSSFDVKNMDNNVRSAITSIYYLLKENEISALHRIKSDEIWYYHAGEALTLVAIDDYDDLQEFKLGSDIENGELMQVTMRAGWIFGATCTKGFTLTGCAVAPGFHFCDFELMNKDTMLEEYPKYKAIIEKLCKD
jgi:uncharacterized protein